jgi:hypothetical protein
MKRILTLGVSVGFMVLGCAGVLADNSPIDPPPCIDSTSYGPWSCSQQGTTNTTGTLTATHFNICVGGTLTPPGFATNPTFNNGQKTAMAYHSCDSSLNGPETDPEGYTAGSLSFMAEQMNWPAITGPFYVPGIYIYTAEVEGIADGGVCANITGIKVATVTVVVVRSPPIIIAQPTNQFVGAGSNATFTVAATGCPFVNYQWEFNGTNIVAGATNCSLTITNVQPANLGSYLVTVSDPSGSTNSAAALLSMLAPAITQQPTNQTVIQGGSITFDVTAVGMTPLSYQWLYGTNILAGATNTSLAFTNVQSSQAGIYSVMITNIVGGVISSNAVLAVVVPPAITQQPVNQTVIQGGNASFSVTATGAPLSYQWLLNGTYVLAGATNASLTLTNVQSSQTGNYSVMIANSAGSVVSSNAVLTVLAPPFIITQPASRMAMLGGIATLAVTAGGTPPLTFQWCFNSTGMVGATNATLAFASITTNNGGNYFVVVTNTFGSVTSQVATLTVVTVVSPTNDSDYDGRNDAQEIADGTDPFDPGSVLQVRLGYWPFDDTNAWTGAGGQLPLVAANVVGVPSWSTNAVLIDSANPAILQYRDVETNGGANINLRSGTIRFWFKPDWSGVSAGGTGPQDQGRLIEMGRQTTNTGWWTLMLDTNGNTLNFITQTNGVGMTNLTTTIIWASNVWHQIVLTYGATNSMLYIDGQAVVTNGLASQYWPNATERSAGFCIGSDATGNNQAKGVFDELDTFNYPLDAGSILANYQAAWNLDSDGDGLSNILENELGLDPYASNSANGLTSTSGLQVFTPLK